MALRAIEAIYIVVSTALVITGLAMVGLATRAYFRTERRAMLFLSIGFSIIVAAAVATTVSGFVSEFGDAAFLLTVHFLITTIGYLVIIYSVTIAAST